MKSQTNPQITLAQENFLKLKNRCVNNASFKDRKKTQYFHPISHQEGFHHAIICAKNLIHSALLKGHMTVLFHFRQFTHQNSSHIL
jgi:hypothetical protein